MHAAQTQNGWRGCIELTFRADAQRSVLSRRRFHGPLSVQRPFYPEGAPCHVYLLHPPGGVVGGDALEIIVMVETGGHALITTPASGKYYRSTGAVASQRQHLTVAEGGILEWLPQDTILFNGCNAALGTRIELAEGARFIGWEIMCLGRPACGEGFEHGYVSQHLSLFRCGRPVLIERQLLPGSGGLVSAPWGMSGCCVTGVLLASNADERVLRAARAALPALEGGLLSVTLLDEALVCRYLGRHGAQARHCFQRVWQAIRPLLLGRAACPPRIWST